MTTLRENLISHENHNSFLREEKRKSIMKLAEAPPSVGLLLKC
jgi:hypothetical protein